ncbi:MAG TPA: carboxypeptidase-like regulatory domain-containing protein [Chitinophagaceae bacterium]|nr:carboxypeptidase-like regulatory domain-containing protein [Chitinophagaceae bacterium]
MLRRIFSFLFLLGAAGGQASGQKFLNGHVLDSASGAPLRAVEVFNRSSNAFTTTDDQGYFNVPAGAGDQLQFSLLGYRSGTLLVGRGGSSRLEIRLAPLHVSLRSVSIRGRAGNYQSDSAERFQDFAPALSQREGRITTFPELTPLQSMQNTIQPNGPPGFTNIDVPILSLNLDAVFDHLSPKRRRLWKFQRDFYSNEQRAYVRSRVTEELVHRLTGLNGDSLTLFIGRYTPVYSFVRRATDYELDEDIRQKVGAFRKGKPGSTRSK